MQGGLFEYVYLNIWGNGILKKRSSTMNNRFAPNESP